MLPPYDDLTSKYIHTKYLQKERASKIRPDYNTATKSQTQIQGIVSYNTQGPSKINTELKDSAKALPIKPKGHPIETARNITKTIPREPKLDIKQDLKSQKSEVGTRFKSQHPSLTPPKRADPTQQIQSSNQQIVNPREANKVTNQKNADQNKKNQIVQRVNNEQDEAPQKNSKSRVFTEFTKSETKIQLEIESFRNDLEDVSKPQSKVDDLMQTKLDNLKKKPQSQLTPMEREMLKLLAKKK